MPFYLAPIVGSGARKDPFRAVEQMENEGASMIDLRPDGAKPTGRALLHLPESSSDRRLVKLADDRRERVGRGALNALRNRLDGSVTWSRLDVVVAKLLRQPPSGRWKPLQPTNRGEYEIWLGGERIYWEPVIRGGATDDFTRSNETPLASPWVKMLGSNVNLVSNTAQKSASSDITYYYYSGAASTDNQYAQAIEVSGGVNWGVALRIQGSTNYSAYTLDPYTFGNLQVFAHDSTLFTNLASTGLSYTIGDTIYLEVNGSSIMAERNSVQAGAGFPLTNTLVTGVGNGPGLWMYGAGATADNWEGGDLSIPSGPPQRFMWMP